MQAFIIRCNAVEMLRQKRQSEFGTEVGNNQECEMRRR